MNFVICFPHIFELLLDVHTMTIQLFIILGFIITTCFDLFIKILVVCDVYDTV